VATIANDCMEEVVDRLRTFSPAMVDDTARIRRDHRTVVPRDDCPRIHVIDGDELPDKAAKSCYVPVEFPFIVAIFVRDDAGFAAADPLKIAVMAALDPATAYPHSAVLKRGRIVSNQEIADADSLRVDMEFVFKFQTLEWALDG